MIKQIILPLVATVAFIVLVGFATQGKIPGLKPILTPVPTENSFKKLKTISIGDKKINIELALNNEQKKKGLSQRTDLPENEGMLFVYDGKTTPSFWMKDTLIPLDIIWIKDGVITKIQSNVLPETGKKDFELTIYKAPGPTDYVLEIGGGFCEKNKITRGQKVSGLEQL